MCQCAGNSTPISIANQESPQIPTRPSCVTTPRPPFAHAVCGYQKSISMRALFPRDEALRPGENPGICKHRQIPRQTRRRRDCARERRESKAAWTAHQRQRVVTRVATERSVVNTLRCDSEHSTAPSGALQNIMNFQRQLTVSSSRSSSVSRSNRAESAPLGV